MSQKSLQKHTLIYNGLPVHGVFELLEFAFNFKCVQKKVPPKYKYLKSINIKKLFEKNERTVYVKTI